MDARVKPAHDNRVLDLLLLKHRQLRPIIRNKDREQARRLGRARILADEMFAAGRLKALRRPY